VETRLAASPQAAIRFSLLVARLRSSPGIFWIQPSCGHGWRVPALRRKRKVFGWRLTVDIFLGGGRDEAVAPSNHSLKVLRLVGIVRRARRILRTAVLIPCSTSTNTSLLHSSLEICSRVTSWPRFSTMNMSSCSGRPSSRTGCHCGRAESDRNPARNRRSGLSYPAMRTPRRTLANPLLSRWRPPTLASA